MFDSVAVPVAKMFDDVRSASARFVPVAFTNIKSPKFAESADNISLKKFVEVAFVIVAEVSSEFDAVKFAAFNANTFAVVAVIFFANIFSKFTFAGKVIEAMDRSSDPENFDAPLKIFVPLSIFIFVLGVCYGLFRIFIFQAPYGQTSALLISTAVLTFLVGLVSEQIAQLRFARSESNSPINEDK